MVRIICVANQKGGVAKTTTTIHIGVALASLGKKVLLVDLDPQGHLAEGFNIEADSLTYEISDVLEGKVNLDDIILRQIRSNIDLAPSNIRLSDMELTLVNARFREHRLRRSLESVADQYDFVLLDCPPSLGLLTVNAFLAANEVLVPMASEYLSMLGVRLLVRAIDAIRAEGNPGLSFLGILHTRHKRTIHAREVVQRTVAELGDTIHIFSPPVPESTRFPEAAGMGKTVFDIAPNIPGAAAYHKIAEEIAHG
jgi:chromosome partitioning protein